jgi:hypothetical protein
MPTIPFLASLTISSVRTETYLIIFLYLPNYVFILYNVDAL